MATSRPPKPMVMPVLVPGRLAVPIESLVRTGTDTEPFCATPMGPSFTATGGEYTFRLMG